MPSIPYTDTITVPFEGDLDGVAVIGHDQHPVYGVPADSQPRDGDFHVIPVTVDGQEATFTPPDYPDGRWHVWTRSHVGGAELTTRVGSYAT